MRESLPAAQSTDPAVLGIVQKHFLHAVALARGFQEAQRDLDLDNLLAASHFASASARRNTRDKLARVDAILREHRGRYQQLMARFDSELAALQPSKPAVSGKHSPQQLIALLQQRTHEQAEAFRLREEWARAARDLLALVEENLEQIQFDADGLVFEDPELVERWARQNDRLAQIASRETDVVAQHRLRMLETAERLAVRVG